MSKFLNTSAANYYLEELIKGTRERLVIISPFLKINERIKQLIEDLDRLKIDVRIVYGKSELAPKEIAWLRGMSFVRTSYCDNLHAKCYLNEKEAILTSLNLYDFSQINNNEMGVRFSRSNDSELYADTYDEAMRIIRVSDEVKLSAEVVDAEANGSDSHKAAANTEEPPELLSTSKLGRIYRLKTKAMLARLQDDGYLESESDGLSLTAKGEEVGARFVEKSRFGPYFLWPKDLVISG